MIGINARISSTATNLRSMRTHFAAVFARVAYTHAWTPRIPLHILVIRIHMGIDLIIANFPNKSMDRIYWIIKTTTAANFCARITSQAIGLAFCCNFRETFMNIFILVFHVNHDGYGNKNVGKQKA